MITIRLEDEQGEWIQDVEMPCVPRGGDNIFVGEERWRVLPSTGEWHYSRLRKQWFAIIVVEWISSKTGGDR